MACTDGNGVQSTPDMPQAKNATMLGVSRLVVVSYPSSSEETATVPRAGTPVLRGGFGAVAGDEAGADGVTVDPGEVPTGQQDVQEGQAGAPEEVDS